MDEQAPLPELTRRQQEILALIIRTFTESPEPVSSRTLVEKHGMDISSATVRNEMVRLEEMGYIAAPHTSAGRIPTVLGYRYFVRELMNHSAELTLIERQHIEGRFAALPTVLEQWLRQSAILLARTVQLASLITPPVADTLRFKHLELIAIQGRLTLMVLVLQGGTVHQRMLTLAEPMMQATLSETAARINLLCDKLTANELQIKSRSVSLLEREVVEIAAEVMQQNDVLQTRIVYREGLSEIIQSFPDSEGAQQAVRVFEDRAFLDMILTELLHPADEDPVQVLIAGDGRRSELNRLSMVLSPYGVRGQMSGTLGVVGPTNINYERAISAVRYISSIMTDMLVNLYTASPTNEDANLPAASEND
jgi:heat-inducible transcriptional repressor